MWQGNQYMNFDVQSGYHTLDEDFGFSFNAAVNSSLQDLNAIRIYVNHNYGVNSFNTSILLQVKFNALSRGGGNTQITPGGGEDIFDSSYNPVVRR